MKIYTHTSGKMLLPQFQMFGFISIALGVYLLINSNWFGALAVVIGFVLYFAVTGIQIDLENSLYRQFFGLFNVRYGKWIKMPRIAYITVFFEQYSQRGSVGSIDSTSKFRKANVDLVVEKNQKLEAGSFNGKQEAMNVAGILAKAMKVKLLDYTEKEPRWVGVE